MAKAKPPASVPTANALANLFAPEALDFRPKDLLAGAEWRAVYAIQAFPPTVDDGWLSKAANLPGVTFALHAIPQDAYELVQALNRRIGAVQGQLALGKTPALTLQRLQRELDDAQALLRQIDAEQQAVFQVGVYLVVAAPDAETGQRRAKRLVGQLAAQGMRVRPLVYLQEAGLRASGPFGLWPAPLRGDHLWPVATIAAGWPFGAGGINHGSGIVLGHDTDGGIVLINRWNPPPDAGITNKNFAILSPPGGGKSHATKLMMLREWAMGAKVFVIDPEREYRPLCRAVSGTWINAAGGHTRINPLQAPDLPPDLDDEGAAGSGLHTHIQRVLDFFRTYAPDLTPMQRALLEQAVEAAYRARGIALDAPPEALARLGPEAWPHVGDVYAYCRGQSGTEWETLAALLRTAGEGVLADLWAGPSTVPPTRDANFVVIDIHDLQDAPDQVRRAQYLNVLGYLWDLVRADRSERKLLVVDEAWMLIDPRAPEALKFMKSLSKRIRKYGGSFMVATQNVVDFLAPAVRGDGEQVLSNAAFTLLLRQGGKDLQALTELFQLSDAEQDRLANARVGEGLLIAGNQRAWVTIDTAPHEAAYLYGRGGG
ncbi:MAG: conjugal transfer protein TraC [Firmicutes bacterium]|nr:conjugal transfer protein TraC [Alicyclobacillaceae bacterium]MCL6497036.1 conjugal transfer protein TraC [Bacillota bacterium]